MNKQTLLFILLILPAICFGQSKMVCDQKYDGQIFYGIKTTSIKSISQLPTKIQDNVTGYLKQALGPIFDSIILSHGQIVNLKKLFKFDTAAYRREWVVTKYDLSFLIHDKSIGIENYYVNIRMDEFGQVVFSNWPRHSFSDRQTLSQLDQIEKIALKRADEKSMRFKAIPLG